VIVKSLNKFGRIMLFMNIMFTDLALERCSCKLSFAEIFSLIIGGSLEDTAEYDSGGIAFSHRKGEATGMTL
jgi:hypothetical protein